MRREERGRRAESEEKEADEERGRRAESEEKEANEERGD